MAQAPNEGSQSTSDIVTIDRLATSLALNHVHLTVPDASPERRKDILVDSDSCTAQPRRRIVVVVGAGASMAAGLPGTSDVKAAIKESISPELLQRELLRLNLEYRLDPDEFETVLLAASRFNREGVLKKLQDAFGERFRPSLCYELLAHMLKHRFVDAIINFNFDELLDQSIEDEIGKLNYLHVVSDGDCPADIEREMLDGRRFRRPVYVKPHGTVSYKSTMRFTRGDYLRLPTDIHNLLGKLLSEKPVTLIVIGFKMQSFEFSQIVKDSIVKQECAIFNFDLNEKPDPSPGEKIMNLYDAGGHIPVSDAGGNTLDKRMLELWAQVETKFTASFKPRNVARHELVCSLNRTYTESTHSPHSSSWKQAEYLHDRAVIELALSTAKAKGFVNTRVLLNGRPGEYFQLWRTRPGIDHSSPRTLYDMCQSLHLYQCSYSREALRLQCADATSAPSPQPQVLKCEEFRDLGMPVLAAAVRESMKGSRQFDCERGDLLCLALQEMFDNDEVEVVNARRAILHEMCAEPESIDTLTALKACTADALAHPEWDTLLCIAETGEWLLKENVLSRLTERKPFRLALIVADDTQSDAVNEKLETVEPVIRRLDWWLHNQHMTLFVQGSYVQQAIFFERRLRNPRIAPLVVKGDDAQELLKVFFAYWLKADRSGPISAQDVENAQREFFSER